MGKRRASSITLWLGEYHEANVTARVAAASAVARATDIAVANGYSVEMTGNTIQITPFMHVADLDAAVDFFVGVLGFNASVRQHGYACVEREGAGVRIQQHDGPEELGRPHGGFAYYIDVRDLAAVQAQIGPGLASLPEGHVHGPVDQSYGRRELMIRAPDGNLVVFGQAIG